MAHHITGMIGRSPQYTGSISHGTLEGFAAAPEASFADVSATPGGFPSRVYRRAVCLADAPNGNVFVFDVLRMADGMTVTTELAPPIETTRGFRPGYYDGALVTDESRQARFRVARVANGKVVLDRPCRLEDFADADGDGRRLLLVYDHGEGDEALLTNSVFLRIEDGRLVQQGEAEVVGL